jgi:cytochrome c peroxidase
MKHSHDRAIRRAFPAAVAGTLALACGAAFAHDVRNHRRSPSEDGVSATELRALLSQQPGGAKTLQVPARDADIPLPSTNPRYRTTEAKRFLGKMLFHDPVRTARINVNQGQPLDLPAGTAFGGTVNASDPNVQRVFDATRQTGSCGSCHIGEAAGKAGQLLNFNTGGEGRGYTDRWGNFTPRRRPQSLLTKQRSAAAFPGDALVDALPTLTDIYIDADGRRTVTTPALFYHSPAPRALLATGRLDELDSVGRLSPSMIGFAFNNRLLFGGFAGEPQSTPGSLNPFSDPAQENLTLLLLDAHRMIGLQSAELIKRPVYVKLFRDAFPEEAAQADQSHDLTKLINDETEFRAQATFLRTVVTRNTPFDRFLAGDDSAMTPKQRRGARLFFTPAMGGAGGAGCSGCHSGPMLNKQPNDPDVAGVGAFVDQNFHNVGIGDHPVQALNALARGRLDVSRRGADGFAYHAEDTGREEVTHDANDRFKFRTMTLRQLADARNFFHNGSFTQVRDVVEYFNRGVPQDPTAANAGTLSPRFTNPRGPGYPRGLGLSKDQVDDLSAFLEEALYDPTFVFYDPASTTDTLQPNVRDLTYSKYRTDLAALGAKDGLMPSGLAVDDNDPLARRDQGLEFLNVTSRASIALVSSRRHDGRQVDRWRITNSSPEVIDTHLLVIARGAPRDASLVNASGTTRDGLPYRRMFLRDGVIAPGDAVTVEMVFDAAHRNAPVRYALDLLSGQGRP